jgi:hypothetical protein
MGITAISIGFGVLFPSMNLVASCQTVRLSALWEMFAKYMSFVESKGLGQANTGTCDMMKQDKSTCS